MKITTEHCVFAIIKYFYDNEASDRRLLNHTYWKRLSKSGSGNNIVRVFENKKTGTIVNVTCSDSQILGIHETKPKIAITGIKSYLREKLREIEEEDWHDLPYVALGEENVVNWPKVREPDLDEGG